MARDFKLGFKISADGGDQAAKEVARMEQALKKVREENAQVARTAAKLREVYNLSDAEIQQVQAAMAKLADETKRAGSAGGVFQGVLQGVGQQLTQIGFQAISNSLRALTQGLQSTIQGFIQFEAAIKQAGVISGSFGTPEFESLSDEVVRLGIVTSKTPQEIAATAVALSRAGFAAGETSGALEGIARASEATGESLETVGDIVAKTYRTFQGSFEGAGLSINESSKFISNALVQTANSTNTSVAGLGESLTYIGPVAAAANQPLDDMLVLIGLLGDAGIQGSMAGTNLASALDRLKIASAGGETEFSNLVRGSKRATEAFNQIGAEVRNADGSMKSVLEVLPIMQQNLAGLGQADKDVLMKALFGVEGGRAFQALLNVTPDRLALVTDQVKNLAQEGEGAAIRGGEQMLSGLSGALDLIGGSIATLGNQFGEALGPALEGLVRFATEVINTLIATEGLFDPLNESAERFNTVLTQNPALVEDVADTLAGLISEGVSQLAQITDALTAFVAEEGNIQTLTDALDDTVVIITTLGQAARFVAALTESLIKLKTITEELPVVGKLAQQGFDMVNPFKSVEMLRGGVAALGQAWETVNNIVDNTKEFIAAIIGRFDVLANNPVVKALVAQLVQAETAVGGLGSSLSGSLTAGVEAVGEAGQNAAEGIAETNAALAESTTGTAEAVTATEEATSALDGLATANQNALDDITTNTANATAALLENGGTQAEIAALEKKALEDRVAQNKTYLQQLKDAQAAGGLSEEDATAVAAAIRQVEGDLARHRVTLAQQTVDAQKNAAKESADAAEEAAQRQADALKETRDEAKRLAEETFGDSQREEGALFSKSQADQAEAFQAQQQADQKAFNKSQETAAKGFQKTQQADQEAFAKGQATEAKAFQKQQQAEAKAFQESQQAAAKAFQKSLDAERDKGNREFDVLGSEVDRRLQLEEAVSAQQRRELEEQFRLEDEQLEKRRKMEAEVLADRGSVLSVREEETQLSPLEQARAAFEEGLQAKADAFAAAQQEEAAAFDEQQQLAAEAFDEQQRIADQAFQEQQQLAAEAFQEQQQLAAEAFAQTQRDAEKAFREEQQTAEQTFADQQREAERIFNEEQRRLDKQNADQIAAVLAAAKPAGATPRRDGGPVRAGQTYLVGEVGPELIVPSRSGYVLTAKETAALERSLNVVAPALSVASPSGNVESQLNAILRTLQRAAKRPIHAPQHNTFINEPNPAAATAELRLAELRQRIRGGAL